MADVYEQNLPQKSTLTTSDFIRVVGSDNVSYKQLVSDVAEKIINTYASQIVGKTRSVKSAIESKSDVPATTNGWLEYFTGIDFGTVTKEWAVVRGYNSPTGNVNVFFYVHTVAYTLNADGTVNAGVQTAYAYSGDIVIYTRRKATGEEWGAWQKLPTRAEVDALNSNATKTFTTLTKSTSIDTFECYTYKYGSLFTGYIVFKPSNDIADDGEIVTAGVPTLITAMQLPITCIAGTQAGQTGRCRIGSGKITNWYSAMSIKAGNTYLIPVNAICS